MTDLEEKLQTFEKQDEKFEVNSLGSANWCLKKIKVAEYKKAELKQLVADEKAKLDLFFTETVKDYDDKIEYFSYLLEPYIAETLKDEKKKSVKLPVGVVGFRASQPKIERDEEKLLAWVKANKASFVKVSESVNWGELKTELKFKSGKAITTDGEVVPGITVEEQEAKFYVKVSG